MLRFVRVDTSFIHEIWYSLISKVVHHFNFDLLKGLSALFATFSCRLEVKLNLRAIKVYLCNWVLSEISCDDETLVSVLSHHLTIRAVLKWISLWERGYALQNDINQFYIQRWGQDRVKSFILRLELGNALIIFQFRFIYLAKPLIDNLDD